MTPRAKPPVDAESLLESPPYSLPRERKAAVHAAALRELTRLHYDRCPEYRRVLDALEVDPDGERSTEEQPFLPVRLFKEFELASVERSAVMKTLTSSGTSGQAPSKIFLDRETAALQTKVLAKIAASFLGNKRLPMLVIDSKSVLKDRALFSARGAGILGFSFLGRDVTYALDADMRLDLDAVLAFCDRHRGSDLLLFGFTYIVWEHFRSALLRAPRKPALDRGILVHGGGWKKLLELAVDDAAFRKGLKECAGIARVHGYYGMVEQTGSIFMECEEGALHCSDFSDVVVRGPDLAPLGPGKPGILQVLSLLPRSYPGHSLLSEDSGEWLGEDDCPCGRMGKRFRVHGRLKNAELRGCGDTYAAG